MHPASQTGTDGASITATGVTGKEADPFDIGGGHINPNKALDPGLVFNVTREDYIHYLCSLGYSRASIAGLANTKISCTSDQKRASGSSLNLPSITIPDLEMAVAKTVTRTVTNVGHIDAVYKALVRAPPGIKIKVQPRILIFNLTTQTLSFRATFFSTQKVLGDYKFGSLTWTDGNHLVRSPIAIRVIRIQSYAPV